MNAPQQPTWFSRNWKWLLALGIGLPAICCLTGAVLVLVLGVGAMDEAVKVTTTTTAPGARVDCGTPGPGGVDCTVQRTHGTGALQACWDLEITCANGGVMVGDACGSLGENDATSTVNMPVSGFSNQEGCDAPKNGAVTNLVVQVQ